MVFSSREFKMKSGRRPRDAPCEEQGSPLHGHDTGGQEVTMSMAESFGRSGFARFMSSPIGRVARGVVGAGLIGWGYLQLEGTTGIVLIVVGLVPLIAGVFNLCLVSALLGGPISGRRLSSDEP
jgi:hypothetical protein